MQIRHFLFLQRQTPQRAGPEAFDLALTAAAFDHEVTLLLLDDGVFWLTAGLPPLVTASIECIAVERQSLAERGLADFPLASAILALDRTALPGMIAAADHVVGA